MDKLPEQEGRVIKMRPSLWRRYRPAMLIAASMIAAIFSVNILLHKSNASMPETSQSEQVHKSSSYSAIDQAADYTMLDNEEIYAYVTEDQRQSLIGDVIHLNKTYMINISRFNNMNRLIVISLCVLGSLQLCAQDRHFDPAKFKQILNSLL